MLLCAVCVCVCTLLRLGVRAVPMPQLNPTLQDWVMMYGYLHSTLSQLVLLVVAGKVRASLFFPDTHPRTPTSHTPTHIHCRAVWLMARRPVLRPSLCAATSSPPHGMHHLS